MNWNNIKHTQSWRFHPCETEMLAVSLSEKYKWSLQPFFKLPLCRADEFPCQWKCKGTLNRQCAGRHHTLLRACLYTKYTNTQLCVTQSWMPENDICAFRQHFFCVPAEGSDGKLESYVLVFDKGVAFCPRVSRSRTVKVSSACDTWLNHRIAPHW